jgi:hypothetical protein
MSWCTILGAARNVCTFSSASRKFMSATPNITAFVVPTVEPSGIKAEPISICAIGLPIRNLAARESSVRDCNW